MSTVRLIPGNLTMKQNVDMSVFLITDWRLKLKTVGKGLSMVVVMKRKITSEMMTTYFPTLLLITITFATTFFKPFFFEAALSVNLTTMLVMTTIFMSNMEILPSTSDIKMVDIWLVFCQLVPFAEVTLLTAMEHHRDDVKEEGGSRVEKIFIGSIVVENIEIGTSFDAESWLHWLKIGGEYKTKESFFKINISPEKIVLPSMVCLFSLAYAATAILFYLQAV